MPDLFYKLSILQVLSNTTVMVFMLDLTYAYYYAPLNEVELGVLCGCSNLSKIGAIVMKL
jgi:hypothetical protein